MSPRRAAETNLFLNVMQVMDRDASPLPVRRIDEGDLIGAFIRDTSIFFQREGRLAEGPISLRSRGARFLVADLAEGTWRVVRNGDQVHPAAPVSGRSGVLWFEGPPGDYILQKRPPQ